MSEDNNAITEKEKAVIADITAKIQQACQEAKYVHLCKRIETTGGLDYVVNRCIKMMADDKIKLGMALTIIETEMEGMD